MNGLESLSSLMKLTMDHQRIHEPLEFNSDCMEALGSTLKIFSIKECHVQSIEPISLLFQLDHLDLSRNELENLEELEHVLVFTTHLTHLNISNNPIASHIRTREKLILASESLCI